MDGPAHGPEAVPALVGSASILPESKADDAGPNRHVVLPSAVRGDGEPDRRIAQKRWHRRVTLGLRHLCDWAIIRARSRAIKSCGMPFIDVIKSCIALPLNGLTSSPIRFA